MNVVSLFSGIGGFDEGFRRAGFDVTAACEIDPACRRVLRRHFPETEIYDDVQAITETTFAGRAVDVLVGGFPCQDLSVAGRRAGLAGKRSGLWFEFLRIIGSYLPRWVVIENVPGLLSSHGGADFAVLLRGLVECGYSVAWRILDAQYFGLAQRRERVFLVASLRSGRAAEVLFEREGGGWHPAPRREAGERIAATLTAGIGAGRGVNAPGRRREDDVNLVGFGDGIDRARCLTTHEGNRQDFESTAMISVFGQTGQSHFSERPATLRAHGGDAAGGSEFLVAHTLRAEGCDASEDGTGRGTPLIAATLNSGGNSGGFRTEPREHLITAFTERTRAEGRTVEASPELAYALTDASKGGNPHSGKIAGSFGVRRLMPVECERLQGFPEVENSAIIEVCLDPLKNFANAGNRNRKSQKLAGNAEKTESAPDAKSAALNTQPRNPKDNRLVQSDVLIVCGASGVEIRNQERSLLFASNAAKTSWFLPSISPEDFVQASVLINTIAGQITKHGEAGLHQSEQCSIHLKNGKPLVRLSGSAKTPHASDASGDLTTLNRPTKSTTLSPSSTSNLEQQLITSCFSVANAINGFIPTKTQTENLLRIEVVTRFGWTAHGDDGKPISDSARYRMLGNAVAVPCAEWIARRIAKIEEGAR